MKITITLFFLVICSAVYCQKNKILPADDDTYGYTVSNPLRLKKGGVSKSLQYSLEFLKCLKTEDDQKLELVKDTSFLNPYYKPVVFDGGRNGIKYEGKYRMIDQYIFVSSVTRDTITIYVDIYESKPLFIPMGLKYECENN